MCLTSPEDLERLYDLMEEEEYPESPEKIAGMGLEAHPGLPSGTFLVVDDEQYLQIHNVPW
jgi:hypothetical protein